MRAPALPVARLTGIGAESVLSVTRLGSLTTALVRQLELRRQYLPLVRPRLAGRTGQRLATPDRSAEPGRVRQHRLLRAAELGGLRLAEPVEVGCYRRRIELGYRRGDGRLLA